MAEIRLSSVTKRFGRTLAVDAVTLTVADGEFMVFVGPSGCGKSTTLRMVAGLETVSEGAVHLGERDVTRLQPKDRNVAMVFQNYALYAHKNVYDNLGFGLRVRGAPKAEIEKRVRHAASILGIEELLERKPKQLSGGQMQRVALGRALVRDPDAFLLDEPLRQPGRQDARAHARGDRQAARRHRHQHDLRHPRPDRGHDPRRPHRGDEGRPIQQIGRPLDIYDHPANMFVANFIGSPEMNLIEGELDTGTGGSSFIGDGFSLALPSLRVSGRRQAAGSCWGCGPSTWRRRTRRKEAYRRKWCSRSRWGRRPCSSAARAAPP